MRVFVVMHVHQTLIHVEFEARSIASEKLVYVKVNLENALIDSVKRQLAVTHDRLGAILLNMYYRRRGINAYISPIYCRCTPRIE